MGFIRNLMDGLRNYTSVDSISEHNAKDLNPKFDEFKSISKETEDATRESVLNTIFNSRGGNSDGIFFGSETSSSYSDFVYGAITSNKSERLKSYRRMSMFPEINDAVDEMVDSAYNLDENEQLFNLVIKNDKIINVKVSEINKEFEKYISLFDMDNNFQDYFRSLIIDGEIAWENIIDSDAKDEGIIGINPIPPETFNFLIDLNNNDKKGLMIFDLNKDGSSNSKLKAQITDINAHYNTEQKKDTSDNGTDEVSLNEHPGIPLPWEQVTYIDSGIYSADKLIVYPVLEKARKSFRQLCLIEDAVIIHRLVRAPARWIFNVDVGGLPKNKADQELQKIMKRYQTKKFYNPLTGDVSNDYDPHQMLDNFWFAKSKGGEGTSVTNMDTSNAGWTELPELEYFQRKLFRCLKVPWKRFFKSEEGTINIGSGDGVGYDEYRFAKFIMSMQSRFAAGLLKGFITHLKLIGMWEKYELKDSDLTLKITPPATYDLYEQQKLLYVKMDNYNKVTENHEEISKTLAQKKYLNWSDEEVSENRRMVEEEAIFAASVEKKKANIGTTGNPYNANPQTTPQ